MRFVCDEHLSPFSAVVAGVQSVHRVRRDAYSAGVAASIGLAVQCLRYEAVSRKRVGV